MGVVGLILSWLLESQNYTVFYQIIHGDFSAEYLRVASVASFKTGPSASQKYL